ncbi:MAG: hypothetical protein ACI81P_002405 [Neolewinella sp.]|jgi:uncharacterized protein YndB with AHSA1/START domain
MNQQLKAKAMTNQNNATGRTLTIEKTFAVARVKVWEAWTRPENIAKWWGPKGMDVDIVEHDFKVGGKWKYTMQMPNGNEFASEGTFLEIIEGEKIVTSADFKPMTEGVELHVLFAGDDQQTQFTFKVVHPTEDYRKQQEEMGIYNGWGSAFKRLEEFLG